MLARTPSAEHNSERLTDRRRNRRRRVLLSLFILLLLLLAAAIYEFNQSAVRISHVQIFGADQLLSAVALSAMQGSYLGIVPRDSTFFFPSARIRAGILAAYPDIAAVSLFRNGLTGLSIRVDTRVPIARWCGSRFDLNATSSRSNLNSNCYIFDASGVLYATSSTAQLVNNFVVYEALNSSSSPLGLMLSSAKSLPHAFDLARQLDAFGSPVTSVVVRDGEVDDYLSSGTRITYVLGNEQNAYTALVSSRDTYNLADGSVDYIDLRFDGKVYLKKKQ